MKTTVTSNSFGAYAVPFAEPPVVTLYAVQMEPVQPNDWMAPYFPQTITPEMIRAIIREELERYDATRRARKKRRK